MEERRFLAKYEAFAVACRVVWNDVIRAARKGQYHRVAWHCAGQDHATMVTLGYLDHSLALLEWYHGALPQRDIDRKSRVLQARIDITRLKLEMIKWFDWRENRIDYLFALWKQMRDHIGCRHVYHLIVEYLG